MIRLNVNGKDYQVDVHPDTTLLWVLRDHLKLTGTKYACGIGECGSCTVHINGRAERSCTMSVGDAKGKKVTTIEGLPPEHPVKRAWIEEEVVQCGFCQPGAIMQVSSLLEADPNPDKAIEGMDDFICRCGTHVRMKKGIKLAAK
ncbi:MAG: (2Fe-2S)-binding protein, partial [Deltaproteobacteria bacterium]|nr:(2Fe-2S)-binding protein [Deltaproteobacteria bacterium]